MSSVNFSYQVPEDYVCPICYDPDSKDRFIEHSENRGNLHPVHHRCMKQWAKRLPGDNIACMFCQTPISTRSVRAVDKFPGNAYYKNIRDLRIITDDAFCSFCSENIDKGSLRDIAGHKTPSGNMASNMFHSDCLKDAFSKKFGLRCGDCFRWIDISKTLNKGEKRFEPAYHSEGLYTFNVSLLTGRDDNGNPTLRTGEIMADGIDTVRQVKESLRRSYLSFNKMDDFVLMFGGRPLNEDTELRDTLLMDRCCITAIPFTRH